MGFLDDYAALDKPGAPPQQVAAAQFGLFEQWLFGRRDELFAELRAARPIFVMASPGPVVVSRFADVLEVASLDGAFGVEPYAATNAVVMGGANFLLGMGDGAQYESEKATLKLAVKRTDLDDIRSFVRTAAKALIAGAEAAAGAAHQLDLPQGYAGLVPLQLAGHYFGVAGPGPAVLGGWIRAIFVELFLNLNNDPHLAAAGAAAGQQLGAVIDGLIAASRAVGTGGAGAAGGQGGGGAAAVGGGADGPAAPGRDSVLGRLLAMQADPDTRLADDRIRVNLVGLLVGMIDNTIMAAVNALDVLFNFPDQLAGAVAAAGAADPGALLPYVLEALRFHSPAPLLVRLSGQPHVLAKGTDRATEVPAGRLIFASNGSAMMDDSVLDGPQQFVLGRPGYQYLHFGWGMHQCFGKYISQVQVTELVRSLLLLPGLRRAAGDAGQLVYEGPFPKSFTVAWN
jgi:cytochrome P450